MSLNLDVLSTMMENLYNEVNLKSNMGNLNNFKIDFLNKKQIINQLITKLTILNKGTITKAFLEELLEQKEELNSLYENFDDKLMIFIVGNGKVGKSTLLNALVGEGVAKVDEIPTTWKIDIYSPEMKNGRALIKYYDGRKEEVTVHLAKEKIQIEETEKERADTVLGNIRNEKLREAITQGKTKEERDGIKKELEKKYCYKYKISEAMWPVKKNWILERCLLVDTPGLKQDLNGTRQKGDIKDYYHKADGVLFLMDGLAISGKSNKEHLQELINSYEEFGGLRSNIIGVINRMDEVKKDRGDKGVLDVERNAKIFFKERFSKIVSISAQQAFEGISTSNQELIEESRILLLQNAIREIFIAKAENVKREGKLQGNNKLLSEINKKLNEYHYEIEKFETVYKDNEQKLLSAKEKLKHNINMDIGNFFKNYLNEVSFRVETNINLLANGNGPSVVKNNMYKLDELYENISRLLESKMIEIKNNYDGWKKFCTIREYTYIENDNLDLRNNKNFNIDLSNVNLEGIEGFTPYLGNDIFSFLGNVIGKAIFFLEKKGLKKKINDNIAQECSKIQQDIVNRLFNEIERNNVHCKNIISYSFRHILFDFKEVAMIKQHIKTTYSKVNEVPKHVQLKDIIL